MRRRFEILLLNNERNFLRGAVQFFDDEAGDPAAAEIQQRAIEGYNEMQALSSQGPLVAATALTTAAGFFALVGCRFDGLRDLGEVGTLGVLAGLVAALVVVPAALRIVQGDDPVRK